MEIKDLLIGAIALEAGCAVATHNRSHFERIPDLEVVGLPPGKEEDPGVDFSAVKLQEGPMPPSASRIVGAFLARP